MINNTRAINALLEIMSNELASVRRRIEAAEGLLSYEAPPEVVERAKAFLESVFEDSEEQSVQDRLDAVKLARQIRGRQGRAPDHPHQERGNGSPRGVAALRDFATALETEFSDYGHAAERMGRRPLRRLL